MRLITCSVAVLLALGTSAAMAQSRTVSTANMPKGGVSYISGPSGTERRETITTATLPTPARLYVGGQVNTGGTYVDGGYSSGGQVSGSDGYYDNGPYYGGIPAYPYPGNGTGYPGNNNYPGHRPPTGNGYPGNGNNDPHRPGDNRPHDGNNSVTIGVKPGPNTPPANGPGFTTARPRPVQPRINEPPPRPWTPPGQPAARNTTPARPAAGNPLKPATMPD